MEAIESYKTFAERLVHEATAKNVYGAPFEAKGKIILPVAKIALGMGTGIGKRKRSDDNEDLTKNEEGNSRSSSGGGAVAKPLGVFEITEKGTRFISSNAAKYFLGGFVLGTLAAGIYFRTRRQKKER